jgi:hypothetical protein
MDDLTRVGLVAALRGRRTYATTGPRVLLDFAVSGIPMGGIGKADAVEVTATAHACDAIEKLEIIRDGEVVHAVGGDGCDMTLRWCDEKPLAGRSWYYLRLTQSDGELAWSSPVWVER